MQSARLGALSFLLFAFGASMTMLHIPVEDDVAAVYESAGPQERERLALLMTSLLRASRLDRRSRSERFQDLADRLGEEARSNGWTDEMDAALLRGEFDDDE